VEQNDNAGTNVFSKRQKLQRKHAKLAQKATS